MGLLGGRRLLLPLLAACVASLATASQASAGNYCAVISGSLPGCTNTFSGSSTAVQNALAAAAGAPGPDTVTIGPGTFTPAVNGYFSYNGGGSPTNGVEIAGQGASTVLQTSGVPSLGYLMIVSNSVTSSNSIHDLHATLLPGAGTGTDGIVISTLATTDIHDISLSEPTGLGNSTGVVLSAPGSRLRSSTVDMGRTGTQSSGNFAVTSNATSGEAPVVSDSTLTADFAVGAGDGVIDKEEEIDVRRVRMNATVGLFTAQAGQMTVQDSLIRLLPDAANPGALHSIGLLAQVISGTNETATIDARHVTVVGGTSTKDVGAEALSNVGSANVSVNLSDSVLADVETSLWRTAVSGVATMDVRYSDYDPATVFDQNPGGSGVISAGAGNVSVPPGFVNSAGGDFSLAPSSPLIDAGDPAGLAATESATDLAGNARVTDGNGDGTARRDIGAFERAAPVVPDTTPPETIAGKFKRKVKGKKATFAFSSDDPTATFTCQFDDGSPKACSSPYKLKGLKKGRHRLMIRALDPSGNVDPTPVVDKFKVKKKKRHH